MRISTLLTAFVGIALSGQPAPVAAQSKPTVAVLYFTNAALGKANEELAPLSKGVADLFINNLAGNPGIRVVERDRIQAVLDEQKLATDGKLDPQTAVKVGKVVGAHHLVTGVFITERASNTMRISVRVFNTETSEVEFGTDETGKTDAILALVDKVATKLSTGIKLPDIPAQARQEQAAAAKKQEKVPFQAVMLYSRALDEKDHGNREKAVTLFRQSLAAFPDYDQPKKELEKLGVKAGS